MLEQLAHLLAPSPGASSTTSLSTALLPDALLGFDNASPQVLDAPAHEYASDAEPRRGRDLETERLEDLFERACARHPDRTAIDFRPFILQSQQSHGKGGRAEAEREAARREQRIEPQCWSYAEVERRATILAAALQARGIGSTTNSQEEADGICILLLPKSGWTFLAMLAVAKAGGAWCPIDVEWPTERRRALIHKARARVVITVGERGATQTAEDLRPQGGADDAATEDNSDVGIVRLDKLDWSQDAATIELRTAHKGISERLAYMIWTSGTTGLPKGVGIRHFSAVQAMRSLMQVIPHDAETTCKDSGGVVRYLQIAEYVFDLSILDVFYTWGVGGTVLSSDRGSHVTDLAAVAQRLAPTHTLLTPAVLAMIQRAEVPSLRVVINGGEKLSQVVADEWSKDGCCLLNLYGPAEATLIAMHRRVPEGDRFKSPNVGVALPTASCIILDESGQLVPKGCVGELCLGGCQLAREYVYEPDKTAAKFVEHPRFGRIYHTGDLARQLADQSIEYLGRADDQVKIHGIRIELLEINAVVKSALDEVADSETMAITGDDESQRIINFSVVKRDDPDAGTDKLLRTDKAAADIARRLRDAAAAGLPTTMVPSLFVILRKFPRTSSAKIDRVALKQTFASLDVDAWEAAVAGDEAGSDDAAPFEEDELAGDVRAQLAKLCSVDAARIKPASSLASIGFDSMRAIALARAFARKEVFLSAVEIYKAGNFQKLVALVRSKSGTDGASDESHKAEQALDAFDKQNREHVKQTLSFSDDEIEAILPVTPTQAGMLIETMRSAEMYWITRTFALPKDADLDRLQQAVDTVSERVDIAGTCFIESAEERESAAR